MNLIAVPVFLALISSAQEQLLPRLPFGKDTTYAKGPLDKDGFIDYEAALNERIGKDIVPGQGQDDAPAGDDIGIRVPISVPHLPKHAGRAHWTADCDNPLDSLTWPWHPPVPLPLRLATC